MWQEHRKPVALSVAISAAVWVIILGTVLLRGAGRLPGPPSPPATVPFDDRLRQGSDDLPLDDEPLARRGSEHEPEQIHLALAGTEEMYVSWATGYANITNGSLAAPISSKAASWVQYGTSSGNLTKAVSGEETSYIGTYPGANYVSEIFHHVRIGPLEPGETYFYRCGDPDMAWSAELSFLMPYTQGTENFPTRVGIIGDLGQTFNSSSTLNHLTASNPPVVLLMGDYSYSDNYQPNGSRIEWNVPPAGPWHPTFQPRWSSWARLTQPLLASRPMMGIEGNHEIELDAANRTFQSWLARYRYPSEASGSRHFYSFDLAGVHFLMLTPYQEYGPMSQQQQWLRADLERFDRSKTPWLVAMFHAPYYSTYIAHYKEVECFRVSLEPLLYEAGVNLIFSGHVHAYESTNRVYNYELDDCAPIYTTIGDGGNIEAIYKAWVDESPENCPPVSGECSTFQDGRYCPDRQPDWSAHRDPSFGHGVLEFASPTKAVWTWHRNQDGVAEVAHTFTTERDLSCSNQQ